MSRNGGKAAATRAGSRPRLAAVPAARDEPDAEDIDWTLDDLLATVDDLVRDLDVTDFAADESAHGPRVGPDRVHSRAFTIAVVFALIVVELLVLVWLLSNM
jgi:hypothetical protein